MMSDIYQQIFNDDKLVKKIKNKLPFLFLLAEHDNSRNGKLGMEIGSARERIIIGMLMYKFGVKNVNAEIPITSSEIDVYVHGSPLSIKTISGVTINGVKLIWTVDSVKAIEFANNYIPTCDMLLTQINWGGVGHMYLFPLTTQLNVINTIGREKYIKLPKLGTNPRGVELSKQAIKFLIKDKETKKIEINFIRDDLEYNAYKRWIDYWETE